MKPLTGAAKTAHERRILLDVARQTITRRDPLAQADTATLVRLAAGVRDDPGYRAAVQQQAAEDEAIGRWSGEDMTRYLERRNDFYASLTPAQQATDDEGSYREEERRRDAAWHAMGDDEGRAL